MFKVARVYATKTFAVTEIQQTPLKHWCKVLDPVLAMSSQMWTQFSAHFRSLPCQNLCLMLVEQNQALNTGDWKWHTLRPGHAVQSSCAVKKFIYPLATEKLPAQLSTATLVRTMNGQMIIFIHFLFLLHTKQHLCARCNRISAEIPFILW